MITRSDRSQKRGDLISAKFDCIIPGLLHTSIPALMSSDTQVLNMSRTSLTGLPSRVFLIHNLTNIQRLHIIKSTLAYIDDNVGVLINNFILYIHALTRIRIEQK